jgi:hypothetical protein
MISFEITKKLATYLEVSDRHCILFGKSNNFSIFLMINN